MAWRERETGARIAAAHRALEANPDCAAARILLSEEEAATVTDVCLTFLPTLALAEGGRVLGGRRRRCCGGR